MPWHEPESKIGADRGDGRGDDGITMIEIIVSLTIMSIFMAMFTTGVVQMFRATNQTEALSSAKAQLHVAFLRLDRGLRYATAISAEGQIGGDWYVEYLTNHTGTPVCTELRLAAASRQLQSRTWTQGAVPLAPDPWTPLASNVSGTHPFTSVPADATFTFQRLRLALAADAGTGTATSRSRQTDVTFTALNSSLAAADPGVCTEGRAVP